MLNIVIPMAGRGSRFAEAGFTDPKPFIPVAGIPMIELVINNLRPTEPHRFIFICQQSHLTRYGYLERLTMMAPGCQVIGLDHYTDGAACSVLYAAPFIDNASPLLIANADQWISARIDHFLCELYNQKLDGLVMTMQSDDPKWSYACLDPQGMVTAVVEKEVVSEEATVGIYAFKRGSDFCRQARKMIDENERSKGEFYVAPVYTRLYQEEKARIGVFRTGMDGDGMHGLGTPEDLAAFLRHPSLDDARGTGREVA